MGDGNGWVTDCACGVRHWGRFGAAGLLVTDGSRVLLQHRAAWTHQGDTWGVPGGARDSHEKPVVAALREAGEETTLDLDAVRPYAEVIDAHSRWSYTTIVARLAPAAGNDTTDDTKGDTTGGVAGDTTGGVADVSAANAESAAITWWPIDEVGTLRLHPGFAASWPQLRPLVAGPGTPPAS